MRNKLFIQKTTLLFLLTLITSCTSKKIDHSKDDDTEIQKIGNLYNPESINTGPVKTDSTLIKKSYEINIFNSDLLENDSSTLENHSKKIALLYRFFLLQNEYDYNKVIVVIHKKNGNKYTFSYPEKELLKIESKKHLNQHKEK